MADEWEQYKAAPEEKEKDEWEQYKAAPTSETTDEWDQYKSKPAEAPGLLDQANQSLEEETGVLPSVGRILMAPINVARSVYTAATEAPKTPEEQKLAETGVGPATKGKETLGGRILLTGKRLGSEIAQSSEEQRANFDRIAKLVEQQQGHPLTITQRAELAAGRTIADIPLIGPWALSEAQRASKPTTVVGVDEQGQPVHGKGDVAGAALDVIGMTGTGELIAEKGEPAAKAGVRGFGRATRIEPLKEFGFSPEEKAVSATGNSLKAAEKRAIAADKARASYTFSEKQGVKPPADIVKEHEAAHAQLDEANFHHEVARKALEASKTKGITSKSPLGTIAEPAAEGPIIAEPTGPVGPKPGAPTEPAPIASVAEPAPLIEEPGNLKTLKVKGGRVIDTDPYDLQRQLESALKPGEKAPGLGTIRGAEPPAGPLGRVEVPSGAPAEPPVDTRSMLERSRESGRIETPKSEVTPEQRETIRQMLADRTDQELIQVGQGKYGVDASEHDFSKREGTNRHRVERNAYVDKVMEQISDADVERLLKLKEDFESKDSKLFSEGERSQTSRAAKARAIMRQLWGTKGEAVVPFTGRGGVVEEPALLIPEEPKQLTKGASGESTASQEAINRLASEKTRGIKRYKVDSRTGKETPLFGVDAVDAEAGPYEHIVERHADGSEVILDSGSKARPLGVIKGIRK